MSTILYFSYVFKSSSYNIYSSRVPAQNLVLFCLFVCCTDERTDTKVSEAIWVPEEHYSSSPEKILSPFSQRFQACRANLQTTSKLSLSSEMVYSKELDLPEGVEIISVQPSAGLYISQRLSQLCKTWLLTVFLKVNAVTYS